MKQEKNRYMSSTTPDNLKARYKNKGDLTNGAITAHLVRMTIPMIWGMLAIISVQLADTYFIALLGTTELAAISFTFPITMILTHLLFGINIAISSVVSRLIGSGERDRAQSVTLHALMMAFGFASVMSLGSYAFLETIFETLGADHQTLPIVLEYMPIWLVAFVILAIPVNGNSAIRANGDSLLPAVVMITIAVINCILDPMLIFGFGPIPAFGVKGAAIATLCAYVAGFCGGIYILAVVKNMLPSTLRLDLFKDSLKRLVVIAIPAGIANIVMPLTSAVIVSIIAQYGAEAVAAYGVVTRVEALAFIAVIALGVGMAPIIGQNWGAKNYPRVHETINLSIKFNLIWSFGVAIILGLLAVQVAGIFSDDPIVIYYAKLFFWIVPISYAFGNLVFGWSSIFNAIGQPQRSFVMIVVKAFAMTIPAVFIGAHFYAIIGIFVALSAVNIISGIVFHYLSWKHCLECEDTVSAASS